MNCAECGSHPEPSAAFCTACGADLQAGRAADGPGASDRVTPEPERTPGGTTEPVPGARSPSPDNSPVPPPQDSAAHRPTPVREMVGSERAAWIDSVLGLGSEREAEPVTSLDATAWRSL